MRQLFILAVIAVSIGCASVPGYPKRVQPSADQLKSLAIYFTVEQAAKYDAATGPEKWIERDKILGARILAIDLNFHQFEQSFAGESIRANLYTDIAVIGIGTAGALVPAENVVRVLSALSAGITGAKGAVNKNVFYDSTMPMLILKMQANRKEVLLRLAAGMAQPPEQYPLMMGLVDIEDYYAAGTLPGALSAIAQQAGADIRQAGGELKSLRMNLPR